MRQRLIVVIWSDGGEGILRYVRDGWRGVIEVGIAKKMKQAEKATTAQRRNFERGTHAAWAQTVTNQQTRCDPIPNIAPRC